MKRITCFISVLLISFAVAAHESQENASLPALHSADSGEEHIRLARISKSLPELDYGGVQGAEWGMTRQQVEKELKPKLAPLDKKQGLWSAEKRGGKLESLAYQEHMVFDVDKDKLKEVRRLFDAKAKKRDQRLTQYRQLKKLLESTYGIPFESDSEVIIAGEDRFVRGDVDSYQARWQGPATTISLRLTDKDLTLSFSQAPEFDPASQ